MSIDIHLVNPELPGALASVKISVFFLEYTNLKEKMLQGRMRCSALENESQMNVVESNDIF